MRDLTATTKPSAIEFVAGARATVEDMAFAPRDGRKYELVKGEIKVSRPGMYHELIGTHLDNTGNKGSLYGSSVGFRLPNGDLLSPDVSFVRLETLPGGKTPEGFGRFAPDLVVEIISPGDVVMDVEEKAQLYLDNGTRIVWVINPRSRRAMVYKPNARLQVIEDGDMLDGDDVLPGFAVKLGDVLGERPVR